MPNIFRSIALPDVPPKSARLDLGEPLGVGFVDRQPGFVQYTDEYELGLRWRASTGQWIGAPMTIATTDDAWAVDGINQQPADFKNQWYRPIHGVAWYRTGWKAILAADYTGGNTLTVKNMPGIPAGVGTLMVRGWLLTYTGVTDNGNGTLTFTGVAGGSGGTTLKANLVPVVLADGNNVADAGGWGVSTEPIEFAAQLWDAGLRLEERIAIAYLNGSQDGFAMDTALYWYQFDLDDPFTDPAPWDQPAGGLGFGHIETGPAAPGHPGSPSPDRVSERSFQTHHTDWLPWAADPPTKRIIKPFLYHRMPAAAEDTGEEYGRTHQVRWVWTP